MSYTARTPWTCSRCHCVAHGRSLCGWLKYVKSLSRDANDDALQARVAEVGQALLRRTQDAGGLGPRRKGKRSRFHMDAYEEHRILPEVLGCTSTPCQSHCRLRLSALSCINLSLGGVKELFCTKVKKYGIHVLFLGAIQSS